MNRKQRWTPDRIRSLRGNLSRAELAERLGVQALTVYRWELEDGAPEARRPRGKIAERLAALAEELAAQAEAVRAPVAAAVTAPPAAVAEPRAEELAELLPVLAWLHDGELGRAEAALLSVLASADARPVAIRALAAQALARCQLWARGDTIGAFSTLLPLLQQVAEGRLPPSVELEVHVTAALVFSSFDGRVFDAGKTSAHVARAERLLAPHAEVQRFLLWMSQLLAANILNDLGLIEHVLARGTEVDRELGGRLLRCMAIEARLIQHYFSRRSASAATDFRALLDQTGAGQLHYLHVRALAQVALDRINDAADPQAVLELVQRSHALCREVGIAVGMHRLFTSYAEGEALFRLGRLAEAEAAWREGVRLAADLRWVTGTLPFFLIRLYLLTGRDPEVMALCAQLTATRHEVYAELSRRQADALCAVAGALEGTERTACIDRLHDAVRALDQHNPSSYLRRNLAVIDATVAALAGDARQAERALRRAERVIEVVPAGWARMCLCGLKGVILVRAGRQAEARSSLEAALPAAEAAGDRISVAILRRLLARVDAALGAEGAAEALAGANHEAAALGLGAIARLDDLEPIALEPIESGVMGLAVAPGPGDRGVARVAAALRRLRGPGLAADGVHREMVAVLRALYSDASVRLEEIDSRGDAHLVCHEGPEQLPVIDACELGHGGGRRLCLRVGLAEPDPDLAGILELIGTVAGAVLEAAALRDVGVSAAPAPDLEDVAPALPGFIAVSPAMRRLQRDLARLARSRSTIIITGESGAGKEVVARALHDLSVRASRPYVAFNCAAVPRELFEGQLFGYRKGSFTGAASDQPGVIRAAQGGTLFLDEIGELPLEVQPKLLRFLENGEISPLGEQRAVQVDVRIIAATFRDLEALVREGRFREDLFYRLQVVPIRVPPLRERPEDIVALARFFVNKLSGDDHEAPVLAPDALVALTAHSWPGNVRELRNVIERSLAFEPWPRVLGAAHLRIS